jgi:hypothetical protein
MTVSAAQSHAATRLGAAPEPRFGGVLWRVVRVLNPREGRYRGASQCGPAWTQSLAGRWAQVGLPWSRSWRPTRSAARPFRMPFSSVALRGRDLTKIRHASPRQ